MNRFDLTQAHLLHTLKAIEAQGLLTTHEALSIAGGIRRGIEIAKEPPSDVVEHDQRQIELLQEG
jgi:hypothetical protein